MLRSGLCLIPLFVLSFLHSGISAAGSDTGGAIGVRISSMGFGGEIALPLFSEISARLGLDFFNYKGSTEIDGINYDIDAALAWLPLLLDYNPGRGAFRLTTGLIVSMNNVKLESNSYEAIEIGGHTYTPEEFGMLVADIDCRVVAPYLGIGILKHIPSDGKVSIAFDIGAMFQNYKLTLTHEGGNIPPLIEEQFMADLYAESETVVNDMNRRFGVYPVLKIGISFGI